MPSEAFQSLLVQLRAQPPRADASIDELRAGTALIAGMVSLPPDVHWQETRAGRVPAEWVTTLGADREGVLLYFHGGAFVTGSPLAYREIASRLSRATGMRVLVPDYRLAPENPFPAALEDCFAAYRWLRSKAFDPRRIALIGDSAGGNLALATLVSLRDGGEPLPAAGALLSPWLDLAAPDASYDIRARFDPVLHPTLLRRCAEAYLAGVDPLAPLASPLHAGLSGLPPLLVQAGTSDILYDEAMRLAERARAAGVDVTFDPWDGMIHVWHLFAGLIPEARLAIERIAAFVVERLEPD